MPTVINSTIQASGGDYPDPATWEAALPANMVTADEQWNGLCANENFTAVTIAGQTTDATRFPRLTTQAAAGWRDSTSNPLRYIAANGARIAINTGFAAAVVLQTAFAQIVGLQLSNASTSGNPLVFSAANVLADLCILDGIGTASTRACLAHSGGGGTLRRSFLITNSTTTGSIITGPGTGFTTNVENCTLIGTDSDNIVLTRGAGTINFTNVAAFGAGTLVSGTGGTANYTTCATDLSSPPTGWTGSLTYADQFADITNANDGWKLKSGNSLSSGFADLSANFTTDCYGTTITTWMCGCFFLAAGGSGATVLAAAGAVELTALAPAVHTGAVVNVPLASIELSSPLPSVQTGTAVRVGLSRILISAPVPRVGQTRILVPLASVVLSALVPRLRAGEDSGYWRNEGSWFGTEKSARWPRGWSKGSPG